MVFLSKGLRAAYWTRALRLRGILGATVMVVLMLAASQPALAQGGSLPATPAPLSHDPMAITWTNPGDSSSMGYQALRRTPAIHDPGEFLDIEDETGNSATSYTATSVPASPETALGWPKIALDEAVPANRGAWADGLTGWKPDKGIDQPGGISSNGNAVSTGRTADDQDVLRATPRQASVGSRGFTALTQRSLMTCGLRVDGSIDCWGDNFYGTTQTPEGSFVAVASGSIRACAIRTDGTIVCWGSTDFNDVDPPEGTFKAITAHARTSCAIASDDTLACWGYDAYGQAHPPAGTYTAVTVGWEHGCALATDGTLACWGYTPAVSPPTGTYKAIAGGDVHTCAIAPDDTIACWGVNSSRQLNAPSGTYTALSGDNKHSCAIATDGTLVCWGYNGSGQTDAPAGTYTAVSSGNNHNCALSTEGTLECWGKNLSGESDPPEGTYTAVRAYFSHSCAIATDGSVVCWGYNVNERAEPPGGGHSSVALGFEHGCSIADDRTLVCWGDNTHGQTDAPTGAHKTVVVGYYHSCAIAADNTLACWGDDSLDQHDAPAGTHKALVAGDDHNCAIAADDTLECWGHKDEGQTDAPAGTYSAVVAGADHNCAIATDGTLACWGKNNYGQTNAPAGAYKALTAGDHTTCAIASDDTLACWGWNDQGQADAPAGAYSSVAIGNRHSCAIATNDTLACWGWNRDGQTDAPAGAYSSVAIGTTHSCAVTTEGKIACWGDLIGEPPDTTTGTYDTVIAREKHTCAIATDGSISCWPRTPDGVEWSNTDTFGDDEFVPVTIGWDQSTASLDEHGSTVTLGATVTTTVDRMPESGFSVLLSARTAADTATAGADYQALTQDLSFQQSDFARVDVGGQFRFQATKNVTVSIIDDTVDEPDEAFTVKLVYRGALHSHYTGGRAIATIAITDNDHVPVRLGWAETQFTVEEPTTVGDTTPVTLTARAVTTKDKRPESGFTFDIAVNTADGTARQPGDYAQLSATGAFSRGDFSRTQVDGRFRYVASTSFTVHVQHDTVNEPNESFTVRLAYDGSSQPHLLLGDTTATVTLTGDVAPLPDLSTTVSGSGVGGGGFGPAPVAPKFADGFRTARAVPENARPSDAVGDPVPATHPDGLEITYSLSGADASLFDVDEETGQISVRDGAELTLGTTYTVNLTATDSAGFGAIIIVMIAVEEAAHHAYDLNANGRIDHEEVVAAVKDYFAGLIEKEYVVELIKLYFAS